MEKPQYYNLFFSTFPLESAKTRGQSVYKYINDIEGRWASKFNKGITVQDYIRLLKWIRSEAEINFEVSLTDLKRSVSEIFGGSKDVVERVFGFIKGPGDFLRMEFRRNYMQTEKENKLYKLLSLIQLLLLINPYGGVENEDSLKACVSRLVAFFPTLSDKEYEGRVKTTLPPNTTTTTPLNITFSPMDQGSDTLGVVKEKEYSSTSDEECNTTTTFINEDGTGKNRDDEGGVDDDEISDIDSLLDLDMGLGQELDLYSFKDQQQPTNRLATGNGRNQTSASTNARAGVSKRINLLTYVLGEMTEKTLDCVPHSLDSPSLEEAASLNLLNNLTSSVVNSLYTHNKYFFRYTVKLRILMDENKIKDIARLVGAFISCKDLAIEVFYKFKQDLKQVIDSAPSSSAKRHKNCNKAEYYYWLAHIVDKTFRPFLKLKKDLKTIESLWKDKEKQLEKSPEIAQDYSVLTDKIEFLFQEINLFFKGLLKIHSEGVPNKTFISAKSFGKIVRFKGDDIAFFEHLVDACFSKTGSGILMKVLNEYCSIKGYIDLSYTEQVRKLAQNLKQLIELDWKKETGQLSFTDSTYYKTRSSFFKKIGGEPLGFHCIKMKRKKKTRSSAQTSLKNIRKTTKNFINSTRGLWY
jgi:hypothetical protein